MQGVANAASDENSGNFKTNASTKNESGKEKKNYRPDYLNLTRGFSCCLESTVFIVKQRQVGVVLNEVLQVFRKKGKHEKGDSRQYMFLTIRTDAYQKRLAV